MTTVLIVVGVYMAAMLAIGIIFTKKANSTEEYYLSGRSLPAPVLMFTFAATWIGASSTLGKAGLAYTNGISAISPTIGSFIAFFIFTAFAGRIRRVGAEHRICSIPDLFEKRFGKATGLIAALVIAWTMVCTTGTQLIAFSKVLEYMFGPYGVSYEQSLIIAMAIVVFYTMLSGMYGVAYTDVVQGVILLAVIGIVVPIGALSQIGGMGELKAQLDGSYFQFSPDISMIGYTFTSFLYFVAGPPYWQRAFAAKSSKSAMEGSLGGNIIIIFYTIAVVLIGICAACLYPGVTGSETELVLLMVAEARFPTIVYALTIAAILAVIMSTTDSYLILSAQTVTTDIICKVKDVREQKSVVNISRISVVAVGVFALIFALKMSNIFEAMMLSMTQFSAAVAVPALAALFSRKVTRQGMISSMLSGLVFSVLWRSALHNPWGLSEAISGSIVSLIVIVAVSACTQNKGKPAPYFG